MKKVKLSIDNQINDLKDKGVVFSLLTEDEAKKFLRYNNYYFKLKSYARNYPINPHSEKYVNLEFAYLVELSKLDMYIRKMILNMCLDIEHVLKTRLLYDLSVNDEEDGYSIVNKFFFAFPEAKSEIIQKANTYSFISDLAEKYTEEDEIPAWNLVELISFGKFVEFYNIYYQEYKRDNYSVYLKSIKFLRNAAAHSNCLLSSILRPKGKKKFSKTHQLTNALAKPKCKISDHSKEKYMAIPIFHDFVALLLVYNDLLDNAANRGMRDKTMEELTSFFCDENGRCLKHKDYFKKNQVITESYRFITNVIHFINNQNQKPGHKRFLKISA